MKTISKKIIACILAVLLCAVSPMAFAKEFADGETYKVVLKSADRQYCARTQSNSLAVDGGNPSNTANTVWSVNSWVEFDLDLSTVGRYNLGIVGGASGANYVMHKVDVDGKTVIYQETDEEGVLAAGTYTNQKDINIGVINIDTPGTHTIRLELLGVSAIYSQYFFITYLGSPIELSSVKAGDTEIADGEEISAGTDSFTVEFTKNISSEVAENIDKYVSLKSSDGKKIGFTAKADNKKLTVCLVEALKEENAYSLEISKIPDYLNSSYTDTETFSFTTVEGDGAAKIASQTATLDGKKVIINAQMLSSQNVGISGVSYEIFVKHKDGELSGEPVATGVSGEDGFFEAEYELSGDASDGKYTFVFNGKYLDDDEFAVSVVYVSKTTKEAISKAIFEAQDADEVEEILTDETNALYIGADTNELIGSSKLEASVYANFLGKEIDFDDIIPTLKKYIAAENWKQAKNASRFPINDENLWNDLGLNKAKYDFLIDKGTNKSNIIKEIMSYKNIADADEYIKAIDDYMTSLLLAVYNKTDLTLSCENVQGYVNQMVTIPLAFNENVEDITSVSFKLTANGDGMFDLAEINVKDNGVAAFETDDNVLTGTIFYENKTNSKDIAEISLTVPQNDGTYTIELSGKVNYNYEETDTVIDVDIITKEINLTAMNKPTTKPTGSSSRPSGSTSSRPSGGSGGGAAVVTPVTPQQEAYSFTDVSKDHWAYDSVDFLVKQGIIDKTQDKKYSPDEKINREEIVKMMVVALGLTDESAKSRLSDVNAGNSFYKYIASAEKYGIVLGDDEGKFRIGTEITREDICVILHRAVQRIYSFKGAEGLFADDGVISEYAKSAVYDMRGAGIINGMGNGEFNPKGNVTRAQAAKMIYEIVKAVGR